MKGVRNPFRLSFQHVVQPAQHHVGVARRAMGHFERGEYLDEEGRLSIEQPRSFVVFERTLQCGGHRAQMDGCDLQNTEAVTESFASELVATDECELSGCRQVVEERGSITLIDL